MRTSRFALIIPLLTTLAAIAARGDDKDASQLTIERIFASDEFRPKPFAAKWIEDGAAYLIAEDSEAPCGGQDIVRYDTESGDRTVLAPAAHLIPPRASRPLPIDDFALSDDRAYLLIYTNSKRVWRKKTRGDYWVLDRSSRELRQLGGDARPASLMFAKLSPDGRHAAYVREGNIYLQRLMDGKITPLTQTDSPAVINGVFDWAYEEEFQLRDGFRFSDDGKAIAYWQLDTSGVRPFPLVRSTEGLYPSVDMVKYPKVGQRNAACRVGVVRLNTGRTQWIDLPGSPRNHYVARMEWADDANRVVVQQLNRRQNTNRVFFADADSGRADNVLTERDEAWLDVHDELFHLSDGKRFTWISERDGWRHVYLASTDGTQQLLTPGEFDVIALLHVDEVGGWLYFLASPDDPTQRYLYRMPLAGGRRERLTPQSQPGSHRYDVSPDGQWAFHTWSAMDRTPTVDLVRSADHRRVRTLEKNKRLRKRIARLEKRPTEFFRVDIGDGVELDGWCIKPPEFDPREKYPLLIYVYGEPAGQTVVDRWGGDKYLWHLMLAQRGYLVMSFDNRGTDAPRGRAWRKAAFQKIGVLAPVDQAAAVRRVIAERPYVDAGRIGVWGWSGGGSMSLHAVFKYPELYHTAIAVAPMSNQRYYDTIYQERYMGLPGDNVDGFVQGSPINFAHQLRGNLLLVHGVIDDNCHYQATEALINELVAHNKPFRMMSYPHGTHAIREGLGTRPHLWETMTQFLEEKLPPGPAVSQRRRD